MSARGAAEAVQALARRPVVAEAAAAALAELDTVMWRRDVRGKAAEVARASIERGARDSAAIDGADVVTIDASPMGRVLGASIAVTAEVPSQVRTWATAPLQSLAHLHAVAARPFSDEEALGRPRADEQADDPLRLGPPPDTAQVASRLALVPALARADAPAVVVAALIHAELMALRPFAWGTGLVARAAVRLVLMERAVDPSGFTIPERGMLEQGRPAYVRAMRDYMGGSAEGVDAMVVWFATSIAMGARAVEA